MGAASNFRWKFACKLQKIQDITIQYSALQNLKKIFKKKPSYEEWSRSKYVVSNFLNAVDSIEVIHNAINEEIERNNNNTIMSEINEEIERNNIMNKTNEESERNNIMSETNEEIERNNKIMSETNEEIERNNTIMSETPIKVFGKYAEYAL